MLLQLSLTESNLFIELKLLVAYTYSSETSLPPPFYYYLYLQYILKLRIENHQL